MDFLRDILEAWSNRIRSPILGYFSAGLIALNWKPIWFLLFSKNDIIEKFQFFDSHTDYTTLLIYPALVSVLASASVPWIKLFGIFIAKSPTRILRNLQHDQAQEYRIYQIIRSTEEAEAKARHEAVVEEAKISAARRLKEAEEVGGSELEEEIERTRETTEESFDDLNENLSEMDIGLLKDISQANSGTFRVSDFDGKYVIIIGDKEKNIRDRSTYLKVVESLSTLREKNLIERNEDAVSKHGYEFLEWLTRDPATFRNERD